MTPTQLQAVAPWILVVAGMCGAAVGLGAGLIEERRAVRRHRRECDAEDRRRDAAGQPRFPHNRLR